jgi:uncharacterized protein YkwD
LEPFGEEAGTLRKHIADLAVFFCILALIGTAYVRSPEGEYAMTLWKVFQEEGLEAAIAKYKADRKPPETQKPPKTGEPAPKTEDPSQAANLIAEDTEMIYRLTNDLRTSLGVNTLEVDNKLAEMARYRAGLLANIGRITHEIPGEGFPEETFAKCGYKFRAMGENLTQYSSKHRGDQAHKNFVDSKPHYNAMISEKYTKIGVGIAVDKSGTRYACVLFATPQ